MKVFWLSIVKWGGLGGIIGSIILFISSFVIFPPGISLTCKATYESGQQFVTETWVHYNPGFLNETDLFGRIACCLIVGFVIGTPSGVVLGLLRRGRLSTQLGLCGLVFGIPLEYALECLIVIMLNAHRSEQAGPFTSFEVPLVGFAVETFFPLNLLLNGASFLLLHLFKPFGVYGIYLLYLIPPALTVGGVLFGRKKELIEPLGAGDAGWPRISNLDDKDARGK